MDFQSVLFLGKYARAKSPCDEFITASLRGSESVLTLTKMKQSPISSRNGNSGDGSEEGTTDRIMRIISKKALREFWKDWPASKGELEAWHAEATHATWKSPADIKAKYGSASILKEGRVVFNICGNNFRLVVRINYEFSIIYIRFVGTHKQYDQINAQEI